MSPAAGAHTGTSLRPIEISDAEELVEVLVANRAFLQPWEPAHDDAYFTAETQRSAIAAALERCVLDLMYPFAILHTGRLVGPA